MSKTTLDPKTILSSLADRKVSLELSTLDLCFLAALYLRTEKSASSSFSEAELAAVFEDACEVFEPAGELRRRVTHSIRRLREQQMLVRVDGASVVRAGEYALSRLASGIVLFFLEDETLTRENLTLLTRTLLSSLRNVLTSAQRANHAANWDDEVVGPLRVTALELISGIQRRQRGFDMQQEAFQGELAKLLSADWFSAVEHCQSLLDDASIRLRDLNHVLLRDTHQLVAILQEIQELAVTAQMADAEEAVRSVLDHVDKIAAWGAARQQAWSEYYQYVHRFLRDIVRLDPARVLTHRLRERLAGREGRPFALVVAAAPPMRLLREVVLPKAARPPVRRPKKASEPKLVEEPAFDPQAQLRANVRAVIEAGAHGLSDITSQLTSTLDQEKRFVEAGRIADAVVHVSRPTANLERTWVPIATESAALETDADSHDKFEIEEWSVPKP